MPAQKSLKRSKDDTLELADYLIEPPLDAPKVAINFAPLDVADKELSDIIHRVINQNITDETNPPRVDGICSLVGSGKTEHALSACHEALLTMRRNDDKACIFFSMPTHKLANELVDRFNRHSAKIADRDHMLTAAIWRGREAANPAEPNKSMCKNITAVKAAQAVLMDVETKVCPTCSHKIGCAYLAQRSVDADLWIGAHQMMFNGPPKPIKKRGIKIVIIDETIDQAATKGLEINDRIALAVDALSGRGMRLPDLESERDILQSLRQKLQAAIDYTPEGPVSRDLLKHFNIAHYDARTARRLEKRRIYYGKGEGSYEDNRTVTAAVYIWDAIYNLMMNDGPEKSGRLSVVIDKNTKVRSLCVTAYDRINTSFRKPTLLLDAVFDAERVKPLFPQINIIDTPPVDMPHVKIWKAVGRAFAKYEFEPIIAKEGERLTDYQTKENAKRLKKRRAIRCFVESLARNGGGKTLLVGNKSVVDAMEFGPNIETAHFNDLAGRDEFKDVARVVVLGAAMPKPTDVENISACMTGREPVRTPVIDGRKQWYPSRPASHIVRKGGEFVSVEAMEFYHEDDMANRQLRRISLGEIIQALGRPRGVRRTADNPVDVFLLNDVPINLPVDQLFWADLVFRSTPAAEQFAAGGVAFESPTDAAKAYPELYPTAEAAKKALQRGREQGDILLKEESSLTKCPPVRVSYQLKGPKQRNKHCLADLGRVSDIKATLTTLLGPLSFFASVKDGPVAQNIKPKAREKRPSQTAQTKPAAAPPVAHAEPPSKPPATQSAAEASDRFVIEQLGEFAKLMRCDKSRVVDWIGGKLR